MSHAMSHVVLPISCVTAPPHIQHPFLERLTNKQAKLACRTCAECAKLKMRTVHANTAPNHDLAHELVPEIGSCTARARLTWLTY